METLDENSLRMKEIAFIGKVTASLSHEIKNILAIINESSGLAGDLFIKAEQDKTPDLARLNQLNINMQEQVERGVEIIKRLNQFAHSMDEEAAYPDLNDILLLTGNIAKRLARLKEVVLEVKPSDNPINIFMNPFKLEQMVFGCIEYLLNMPEKKNRITIDIAQDKENTRIIISDDSPDLDPSHEGDRTSDTQLSEITLLNLLIKDLGGSIDFASSPSGNTITLSFSPRNP